MTNKTIVLLFFFFVSFSYLNSNITGRIVTEEGEKINSVLVNLERDSGDGDTIKISSTISDLEGNFSFFITDTDIYFLKFLKKGFQTKSITLTLTTNQKQNIEVSLKKINVLEEVRIEKNRNPSLSERKAISSTVLDEETVRNIKINKIDDLSSVSAGLLSVNTGSSLTSFFSLRGVSSANTTEPLVGLYIDNIAQFQSYNFPIHLNSIKSIEILKGPQLTFYGRNAMGGIIDIKTQKLLNRLSINAGTEWGNHGLQKYDLSLTIPLVKEVALLNLSGFLNLFDGNIRNTYLDKNTGGSQDYGVFGGTDLFFKSVELNIGVKYENNKEEAFAYSVNKNLTETSPYTIDHDNDNKNIKNTVDTFLKIKFPIKYFIFNSISTYQYFDNRLSMDLDFSFSPASLLTLDFNSHLITQEFKIKSTSLSSQLFHWLAGSYLYYQNRDINSDFLVSTIETSVQTKEAAVGIALFGSITYPIIPQIHLIVGLRGDYDYRSSLISRKTIGSVEPETENQKNNFNYAPKLAFNFYPLEELLIYISVTRGYRNGGINPFVSDGSKVLYNSEDSWNSEIGLKYDFFGGNLNTSFYYIFWQNQQVNIVFLSNTSFFEFGIVNAGKSQNIGYELEIKSPSLRGVTLGGNFSYIYSRYLEFSLQNFTNQSQDLKGKKQSFVPDLSSSLFLEYKYSFELLSKRDNFIIRGTFKYLGEIFFDSFNQQRQEPYYLFDLTTNVQIAGFIVSFWMKNVFNQKYYSLIFSTNLPGLSPNKLGDPMTLGGKISFIF